MAFDLNVTIGGICLMVPDPSDGRLYGLMPPAPGHHGPEGDHVPRLTFRAGHLHKGGSESGSNPAQIPLENLALDLSRLTGDQRSPDSLPPELYDMDPLMNQRISRDLLSGDGEGRLISRVVLGPGELTGQQNGARWRMGETQPRWMATSVRWSVTGIQRDSLQLDLKSLDGEPSEDSPELFPLPIAGRPSIDLYIFHTLRDDQPTSLPPAPAPGSMRKGEVADHFRHFYRLFGHPPVPVFESADDGSKKLDAPDGLKPMCMSATATLE